MPRPLPTLRHNFIHHQQNFFRHDHDPRIFILFLQQLKGREYKNYLRKRLKILNDVWICYLLHNVLLNYETNSLYTSMFRFMILSPLMEECVWILGFTLHIRLYHLDRDYRYDGVALLLFYHWRVHSMYSSRRNSFALFFFITNVLSKDLYG